MKNLKLYITLSISILIFNNLNGQEKESPEYKEVYDLMSIGVSFDRQDIDSFYYWNEYSMKVARTKYLHVLTPHEMNKLAASYYNNKAVYWGRKGKVKKALLFMDTTIMYAKEIKNDTSIATYYNNIGTMYQDQGDVFNAEKSHLKSLRLREKIGDSIILGNSYNNIGFMYYRQGLYDKSIDYFRKSIVYYSISKDYLQIVPTLNLAIQFRDMGELDSFYIYNRKVYNYAIKLKSEVYRNISLLNFGKYYELMGDLDTALLLVNSSIDFFKSKNNLKRLSSAYVLTAQIYLKLNKNKNALAEANLAKKCADSIEIIQYHEKVFQILYQVNLAIGNNNIAVKYLKSYYEIKDSVRNKKFIQDALYKENQLKYNFETDSLNSIHQSEIMIAEERFNSERQYRLFTILGIIALALLSAMLIRNYYLKQKLAKENFEKEQLSNEFLIKELQEKSKKLMGSYVKELKSQKSFQEIEKLIEEAGRMNAGEIHQSVSRIKNELRVGKVSTKKIEKYQSDITNENDGLTSYLKNKYKELTPKELRLCVLLKTNYSTDEICSILGIAASTLKSSRYRIHKKMNLEKGLRLQDYLINLS